MTITLTREEAQSVLYAFVNWDARGRLRLIETLRARLSAPEPEPVAKFVLADGLNKRVKLLVDDLPIGTLFYTTPPQREWQGLTDEEMSETYNVNYSIYKEHVEYVDFVLIYRAIEAKLKEKNHE
jgi:hypothetical protein